MAGPFPPAHRILNMEEELRRQLGEATAELGNVRKEAQYLVTTIEGLRRREKELCDELASKGPTREEAKPTVLQPLRPMLVTRDRKISKFAGRPVCAQDPEIEDWVNDVRLHIEGMDEAQQISTIMSLLTGEAEMEVRLCPSGERDSSEKIFGLLVQLFQEVGDVATLSSNFFSRLQQPQESLQSYSLALMKLRQKIEKRGETGIDDTAMMVRFVEGARDPITRRELRRLQKESATKTETFSQFRKRVLEWMPEETQPPKPVTVAALSAEGLQDKYEQLAKSVDKLLQQQEELVKEMSKEPSRAYNEKKKARGPLRCWSCGRLGHISRNCREEWRRETQKNTPKQTEN